MADNLPVIRWHGIYLCQCTDDGRGWHYGSTFNAPDVHAALSVARGKHGIMADVLRVDGRTSEFDGWATAADAAAADAARRG